MRAPVTQMSLHLRSKLASCLSALFVLASILALHPVIVRFFSTHYLGGSEGDGGLYVWLASSFHADPSQALAFETGALYPYGLTRAWSDSFLLPSAFVHLLALLGFSLPVAYNVVTLAALTLNGTATARLARAFGASAPLSLAAGVSFANSSYIFGNLGHPQLLYFFWVPLAWSLVVSRPESRRRWCLAGLCTAASFYCAVYFAVFAALGLGLIAALSALSERISLKQMTLAGIALAIGLLPIAYALPAYLAVQEAFGERHLYEAAAFAATGLSYLAFSSLNSLWGQTSSFTQPEATLCSGYLITALALVAAVARSWRRAAFLCTANGALIATVLVASSVKGHGPLPHIIAGLTAWATLLAAVLMVYRLRSPAALLYAIAAVFFVLSLGPGGEQVKDEPMWAPLSTLWDLLPGIAAIRAVGRYGAVVVMSINIAAALSLSALRSKTLQAALGGALFLCTIGENSVSAFSFDPIAPTPPAFAALSKRLSPDEPAIVLPFASRAENGEVSWRNLALLNTKYSLWATPLGIRLVNGYSGQRSRLQYDLSESLLSFPSSESVAQLARVCGLRRIVVLPGLIPDWDAKRFEAQLSSFSNSLSVEERLPDGSLILSLNASTEVSPERSQPTFLVPSGRSSTISHFGAGGERGCTFTATAVSEPGKGTVTPDSWRSVLREGPLNLPALARGVRPVTFKLSPSEGCSVTVRCAAALR